MINEQLVNPQNIVVVGGSNDTKKPGGKIIKNLLSGNFTGDLYVVNPREREVQGIVCLENVRDLERVDLAIIVIPARYCLEVIKVLAEEKQTKAFIVLSAGFGEGGEVGIELENQIVAVIDQVGGCLIGPNCIGVLNENYNGIFTTPIPLLDRNGCDLISSSGATAVFIIEAGIPLGLKFNSIYSVGNAAQTSVEDVLEYMDENFDPDRDAKIKLLYLEVIKNPQKLLKHAASLIQKGAKIAAIKSGSTDAGSRAAASHTGAMATQDIMVRTLFDKAGIVYCSSREELISVASIFNYKPLKGKNIAIITHAGGSAVMLADALVTGGLSIPQIEGESADRLLGFLHPGSSVGNPIDFLATGTAEQLGIIIDYCEHKFDQIDAMVVVFGSPGLFDVENVYNVLSVKLDICSKPIFPVLPSLINASKEIGSFLADGNVNFPDEVVLGRALAEVYNTPKPFSDKNSPQKVDSAVVRTLVDTHINGFLPPDKVGDILDASGVKRVREVVVTRQSDLEKQLEKFSFPVVMKVVGPVHKSDVGGVVLNIPTVESAFETFNRLIQIEESQGVLIQSMLSGTELFVGVKKEPGFGHVILCGLGGIFIEILNDVSACLYPVTRDEAHAMIQNLKGYPLFEGVRGQSGIDEDLMVDVICSISSLVGEVPEIVELDLNPIIANTDNMVVADARIRIEK